MSEMKPAYEARWFSNGGPVAKSFESRLCGHFGICRPATVCSNATVGLTAALLVFDLKGRIALPSFTFSASAHAILAAGCEPVLVDVDPVTWEISLENLEGVESLVGVMAVRAFGFARDFSKLERWCQDKRIPLIIDAAAALGARLPNGSPVGSQGDMEVCSLHATKVFAVGEGGVAFCEESLRTKFASVLNFGFEQGVPIRAGLNGKMAESAAAYGMAMLAHIDRHLARRRDLATRYFRWLSCFPALTVPHTPGGCTWQAFPFLLPADSDAGVFVEAMAAEGVELRRYYFPALHQTPCFSIYSHSPLPVSERIANQMVCLPLYSDMSDGEFEAILAALERQSAFFGGRQSKSEGMLVKSTQ